MNYLRSRLKTLNLKLFFQKQFWIKKLFFLINIVTNHRTIRNAIRKKIGRIDLSKPNRNAHLPIKRRVSIVSKVRPPPPETGIKDKPFERYRFPRGLGRDKRRA